MDCVTYHFDNARTGRLDRAPFPRDRQVPDGPAWGKYLELFLDETPVRVAVLFLQNWTIRGGRHSGQTHTMLYVATSGNMVFAYSEEQIRQGDTRPIWQTNLAPASTRTGSNIPPPVGVCGTMVLDPQQRRLFVVGLTDDRAGKGEYHIYSLNLDSGAIGADVPLHDPGSPGRPTFVGNDHDQRGGLLLVDGRVYTSFADFLAGDQGPYRGWLVGCEANDLTKQTYFPVTESVNGGGVWGPGGAAASADNSIYLVTGNSPSADDGYFDDLEDAGRHPGDANDYFEAVVRVDPTRTARATFWTDPPIQIPGWFGNDTQGGGIAVADINANGRPDFVVFHIDHPSGGNKGYYRIGKDVDSSFHPAGGWAAPLPVQGWFGNDTQGGGVAVADITGTGKRDLVVFHIDHPSGGNRGYYRIGWNLDSAGHPTGGWTKPIPIPFWWGNESSGGGIAVADINGSGRPDLVVFHIDNPSGANHGFYRIGWDLDGAGLPTGGWTAPIPIPGWFGNDSQGGGIAIADLTGTGKRDFVVFHIDNPSGGNHGYYRVGWNVDAFGHPTGGWSEATQVPGWFGNDNQAGNIAVADLNGTGQPQLIVFHIDNPPGANHGYYRVGLELQFSDELNPRDWYMPPNAQDLNHDDLDLGGSSALLLPALDRRHGELLVTGGKDGDVYLLDRSNLGHWGGHVWRGHTFNGEARCAPAHYVSPNGDEVVIVSGHRSPGLVAFRVVTNSGDLHLEEIWRATDRDGNVVGFRNAPGSPVIASTPAGRYDYATVWMVDGGDPDIDDGVLWGFDARDGREVFSSIRVPRDALGTVPHYPALNCTEHSVFVGTETGLACYRLPLVDFFGPSRMGLVEFHVDNPSGANHGHFRMGWDVAPGGVVPLWDAPALVPGWFGNDTQAGSVAVADITGTGEQDLIVFHIDNPSGGNHGYYRIGRDVGVFGSPVGNWTAPIPVPGWFGNDNQGGGIAIADINGSGRPDLVVFHIDHPSGGNKGYYRIGWDLDTAGHATNGWTAPIPVQGWFGNDNQGGGIAIADINGSGRPDLVVFHIDHPSGGNQGYYRIGWDLDNTGHPTGGWTAPLPVQGWFGNDNQGGGIAIADINGGGRPDLIVFHIDNPPGANHGYYRIGWDLDTFGHPSGGWQAPLQIPGWFGDDSQGGGIAALQVPWAWVWAKSDANG